MEEYIRWLAKTFTDRTGIPVTDPDTIQKAADILRSHGARWPREEDFVPMVAVEMAGRLEVLARPGESTPVRSFLELVAQTADTVRHRVARAARKRMAHPSKEALDQMADAKPTAEVVAQVIANELLAHLNIEDHTLLTACLDGLPIDEVAKILNVSVRTAYRRLGDVRRRIRG